MKTLEQLKKEKNYTAHIKGYPIDPEGFSFEFLIKRLKDEGKELIEKIYIDNDYNTIHLIPESQFIFNDEILEELADISNIIDYIATKITVNYPTKYNSKEVRG